MRVDIEKSYLDSYRSIAEDANRAARRFEIKRHKISPNAYEHLLFNTNISVEKKKGQIKKGFA